MRCYKCNATLSENDFCNRCGIDVKIYKKIIRSSEAYYNLGLEKAKNRDLSGAVECLKRSVKFNKHNTNARNLLGLVYFEMGEAVAALSQWVISLNLQPEKNIADKYLDQVQRNPGRLDTINQTIKKYNQTVQYAMQESEDLAIIQMKKVLNLYPNMVKGHQLLALLYMKTGDYEKALKPIMKALAIDHNNTLSLQYYNEIQAELERIRKENGTADRSGKNRFPQNKVNLAYVSVPETNSQGGNSDVIIPQTKYKESSGNGGFIVLNVILGIAIGVALFWFLILPSKLSQQESEFNTKLAEKNASIDSSATVVTGLQDKITRLEEDCVALKKTIAELEEDNEVIPVYQTLIDGVDLYISGKYLSAYELLKSINIEEIKEELEDENYISAYNGIMTLNNAQTALIYYEDAYNNYYSKKKYDDAAEIFKQSFEISPTKESAYYLARAYDLSPTAGSDAMSKEYYQYVIDNFPDTSMATNSKNYLSKIK